MLVAMPHGVLLGALTSTTTMLVARSLGGGLVSPVITWVVTMTFVIGIGVYQWATVATRLDGTMDPPGTLRADRQLTMAGSLIVGAGLCALLTHVLIVLYGIWPGIAIGAAVFPPTLVVSAFWSSRPMDSNGGAGLTGHAWANYSIAVSWNAIVGVLPWRLVSFLADMHRLGILRQAGATYQFRHVELQNMLATYFRNEMTRLDALRADAEPGQPIG